MRFSSVDVSFEGGPQLEGADVRDSSVDMSSEGGSQMGGGRCEISRGSREPTLR